MGYYKVEGRASASMSHGVKIHNKQIGGTRPHRAGTGRGHHAVYKHSNLSVLRVLVVVCGIREMGSIFPFH